jgi:hypothetical protein
VHPAGTLLAFRVTRTALVSASVADPDPVPASGCGRQWSTGAGLDACNATGALAAQIDRRPSELTALHVLTIFAAKRYERRSIHINSGFCSPIHRPDHPFCASSG